MVSLLRWRESRHRRASRALSWTLVCVAASACSSLFASACSTPARLSIGDGELIAAADARSSVEDVARALELADLGPLAVPIPAAPSEVRPDQAEFWHAAAFAWNPQLRALRRRVRELREASRSAGQPTALMGQGMVLDASDPREELEFQIMADVFGLLGLGPSAAARELAQAQSRAAFGQLEARVWSLRFEVDRARVELAAARSLEAAMTSLYAEASQMLPRIQILARRGWIGVGMAEGALAALHMVEHRQTMARTDVARMQAELAELCGLELAHPALDELAGGVIDRFRPDEIEFVEPSAQELLDNLPRLRAMKLELAMAEAELQREARERWPMLRAGPRVVSMPGEFFIGPMFGIDIPFPGALEGRIAAARERRDSALEALEGELVMARSRVERAARLWEQLLLQRDEHAPDADRSVARMLDAARAEFMVDPAMLERWSRALTERMDSLTALVRARADLVRAWLDWQEACGPRSEEQS